MLSPTITFLPSEALPPAGLASFRALSLLDSPSSHPDARSAASNSGPIRRQLISTRTDMRQPPRMTCLLPSQSSSSDRLLGRKDDRGPIAQPRSAPGSG